MTHDEKLKNNKKRISQQRILEFMTEPKTYYEIHVGLNLSESHVRQLMQEMPDNWRNGKMVKGRRSKMVNTFYTISHDIKDYKYYNDDVHEGTVYRMMDSPKYHENMKLLRDNRKSATVWVSGTSLSGF
jgi:hypothetical protein